MDVFLSILPIFFIFFIFYFLVIRPQTKTEARRKEFIKNLKKGDVVYTSGGIIGKIHDISDKVATLEISKDVRLKIIKDTIQGAYVEQTEEQEKKQEKTQKEKGKS